MTELHAPPAARTVSPLDRVVERLENVPRAGRRGPEATGNRVLAGQFVGNKDLRTLRKS